MAERHGRQQQHRRYLPHVARHLIVQFQLLACQHLQAASAGRHDFLDFHECHHVLEEILHAVHEHAIHLHRRGKSLLQHCLIVLQIVDVPREYIALNVGAHFLARALLVGHLGVGRRAVA